MSHQDNTAVNAADPPNFTMLTLDQLKPKVIGVTKKDIALQLDKKSKLFNYSAESGPTSYHHYTRDELLQHCLQFDVDPMSKYLKQRAGIDANIPTHKY